MPGMRTAQPSASGITAAATFVPPHYTYVATAVPPVLASGRLAQLADAEQSITALGVLSGPGSLVFGRQVIDNGGLRAILIGDLITQAGDVPTSTDQILIGSNFFLPAAATNSSNIVAIGAGLTFTVAAGHTGFGSLVLIGNNAKATCLAAADASNLVCIGTGAEARGGPGVLIGSTALATNSNHVGLGFGVTVDTQGVAVGDTAQVSAQSVGIGANVKQGTNEITIGFGAGFPRATDSCILIGVGATAPGLTGAIALGRGATATVNNTMVVGSAAFPINLFSLPVTGAALALGVLPAATGGIRLENAVSIVARNATNTADVSMALVTNVVTLGDTGLPTRIQAGQSALLVNVNGLDKWLFDGSTFSPATDNVHDIGITGTNRLRDIYLAGQIKQTAVSGPGALVGTLSNAPATGNPQFWLPITIGGVQYWLPAWHV